MITNLLFEIEEETIPDIPGLTYIPDFITQDEESALIDNIDKQPWLADLKRRVQHYGYKYDYKARTVTDDAYLGTLPEWIDPVVQKLSFKPDQAIVNEYLPGQGISAHVDCVPCFDDIYARECDPVKLDFDVWWQNKRDSFGADDGVEFVPMETIENLATALPAKPEFLVVDLAPDSMSIGFSC